MTVNLSLVWELGQAKGSTSFNNVPCSAECETSLRQLGNTIVEGILGSQTRLIDSELRELRTVDRAGQWSSGEFYFDSVSKMLDKADVTNTFIVRQRLRGIDNDAPSGGRNGQSPRP